MTGRVQTKEHRLKNSKAHKGQIAWNKGMKFKQSDETKIKKKIKAIAFLEKIGKVFPIFSPKACEIIDEYGKQYNYNFQHGMNGGEFHIKELGYFVDGYDKEKNIVIEYYEKRHEYAIEKDKTRKNEIKNFLKCKFIEIWYNGEINAD